MDDPKTPVAGSQTLDRGLRLLWHLARVPGGETLTELSRSLDINRTAVHRMIETLVAHDLVRRGEDRRFRLSYGLGQLAGAVDVDLRGAAYPIMAELADRTGATTHLMVPISEVEVQALIVVEPRMTSAHLAFRSGQRHDITRGSGGVAVLAGRPPADDDPSSVVEARELGYAVSHEMIIPGVTGVSAPVATPPGQPEASLGVSLVDTTVVESIAADVCEAAASLGVELSARSGRIQ